MYSMYSTGPPKCQRNQRQYAQHAEQVFPRQWYMHSKMKPNCFILATELRMPEKSDPNVSSGVCQQLVIVTLIF